MFLSVISSQESSPVKLLVYIMFARLVMIRACVFCCFKKLRICFSVVFMVILP